MGVKGNSGVLEFAIRRGGGFPCVVGATRLRGRDKRCLGIRPGDPVCLGSAGAANVRLRGGGDSATFAGARRALDASILVQFPLSFSWLPECFRPVTVRTSCECLLLSSCRVWPTSVRSMLGQSCSGRGMNKDCRSLLCQRP